LTSPGRSSFDWAVLFAAVALVFPVSGVVGVFFADRSRRKGYGRWRSALAIAIWCAFLGVLLRGLLHLGVF
jgi:succinate dehydrogenase hydrophobic anchor subunit